MSTMQHQTCDKLENPIEQRQEYAQNAAYLIDFVRMRLKIKVIIDNVHGVHMYSTQCTGVLFGEMRPHSPHSLLLVSIIIIQ